MGYGGIERRKVKFMEKKEQKHLYADTGAVSYTHLDVYKRQTGSSTGDGQSAAGGNAAVQTIALDGLDTTVQSWGCLLYTSRCV